MIFNNLWNGRLYIVIAWGLTCAVCFDPWRCRGLCLCTASRRVRGIGRWLSCRLCACFRVFMLFWSHCMYQFVQVHILLKQSHEFHLYNADLKHNIHTNTQHVVMKCPFSEPNALQNLESDQYLWIKHNPHVCIIVSLWWHLVGYICYTLLLGRVRGIYIWSRLRILFGKEGGSCCIWRRMGGRLCIWDAFIIRNGRKKRGQRLK